ncbi:hypothetical protein BZA05DRAFT_408988 [Tricharina praecox]|uniref:uncharacterized protein n=1 Tax=Tricharina praecox TaxID=43433 RepID=UPI00221E5A69|nr:uncharacterized protein BZA05DRAFT_408988 [Tricharina praecox]KAI5844920.1 hypothetical protein BZA05DRAFT_408988 [Tricharina praecox]
MRLSSAVLLPVLALVSVAAARPQDPVCTETPLSEQTFCEKGSQLCSIAMSWDDCSDLYIASMKACVLTNCLQFLVDPLAHCEK